MKKFKIATFLLCAVFLLISFIVGVASKARIDIVNIGSEQNTVVLDLSKNIKQAKYKDLNYNSKENFYLKIPCSLFSKRHNVKITAIGDGNLKIYFRSEKGSLNSVTYKGIEINGELVYQRLKGLSYDNSVTLNIPVKDGEEINFSFACRTKLMSENYTSYIWLGLFLLFFMFYCVNTKTDPIKERNFLDIIVEKYKNTEDIYKQVFWIIFAVLNIVFLFHTVDFMWGNHGAIALNDKTTIDRYINMGRYTADIIKVLLCGGHYIPVLSNLIAFIGLALSSVCLCVYWKLPRKLNAFLICGLLFALQPFILEWMYYAEGLPDMFFIPLYVILGLIFAEKAFYNKKLLNIILSVIFLNFALAAYPSAINSIAVIFLGKIFMEFINFDGKRNNIKNIINQYKYTFISIISAGILYKIVLLIINLSGGLTAMYTIAQISLKQMPLRILQCIKAGFVQLYDYKYIFMPHLTDIFGILLIILIFYIIFLHNNNAKNKIQDILIKSIQIGILVITLISTKTAIMIAAEPLFFEPRIDFFGLMVLRVLIVGVLLSTVKEIKIRNFVILLSIIAIGMSITNDMDAMRVWKHGRDAEFMLWNRYLTRIEQHENFDKNKKYNLIQLGKSASLRKNFYKEHIFAKCSAGLLSHNYDPDWDPFKHTSAFYPKNFVKISYNSSYDDYKINPLKIPLREFLIKAIKEGLLDNAQEYPNKNSILIKDDTIIIVLDENEIKRLKKEINKENL